MTEANDPGLAAEYGRRYHDLQLLAVNVLTDAARLSWRSPPSQFRPRPRASLARNSAA
jgi:hypothetical protein